MPCCVTRKLDSGLALIALNVHQGSVLVLGRATEVAQDLALQPVVRTQQLQMQLSLVFSVKCSEPNTTQLL